MSLKNLLKDYIFLNTCAITIEKIYSDLCCGWERSREAIREATERHWRVEKARAEVGGE